MSSRIEPYYMYYAYSINNDIESIGTPVIINRQAKLGEIVSVNGKYHRVILIKPAHPSRLYVEPVDSKDYFINLSGGVIDLRGES